MAKKLFYVRIEQATITRLKLIATLYRLHMGEVMDNALMLYADKLKLHETVLRELPLPLPEPKDGPMDEEEDLGS